jgi:hypothetical protein
MHGHGQARSASNAGTQHQVTYLLLGLLVRGATAVLQEVLDAEDIAVWHL